MTVMTLSLKFPYSTFKLALLPSVLAASLILTACQESSAPNEDSVQDSTNTTINADVDTDTSKVNKMSAEEEMITNLSRYRWTLVSATDKDSQPLNMLMEIKDQVRLSFNQYQGQNTLSYSVGCNTMSAIYRLRDSTLTIEESMSTKMSCGELDKAENNLSQLMQGDSELTLVADDSAKSDSSKNDNPKVDTPTLTQITSNRATLVWQGKLTSQAKYNSKGETIFWAVNAKTIPCEDNSSQQCLQVKPITYDDQGIKTSEGQWTPFKGKIDGYQHDGKHDEVIRLQRYQLGNSETAEDATADISAEEYAYVLDAVIESSVVE